MSATRQFCRNQIKLSQGNNNIREVLEKKQIRKYGFKRWFTMRVRCDSKHRRALTLEVGR